MQSGADLGLVRQAAEELGLSIEERDWSKIANTLKLLDEYRRSLNLTGSRSWAELEEHAAESLVAVAAARRAGRGGGAWLDVGSGAGFPGLIVGCVWEGAVTLVEPRAKRASFLELAGAGIGGSLEVRRGRVHAGKFENLGAGGPLTAGFRVASARAVFPAGEWAREAAPWVVEGGIYLLHGHRGRGVGAEPVSIAEWGRWRVEAHVPRET